MEDWVGPRAGLEVLEGGGGKEIYLALAWIRDSDRPSRSLVTILSMLSWTPLLTH